MCFSFEFFHFLPDVDRNFESFYINSRGSEEPQQTFSNFLSNFSLNYDGLKVLSGHSVMKFQRYNGIFFQKISS